MPRPCTRKATPTAHFGKWHLGYNLPANPDDHYEPKDQGFDLDFPHTPSAPGPGGGYLAPWTKFIKDPKIVGKPGEHIEDRMSEEAAKYIREHKDGPFFVNYWAYSVHSPWNARHDYIDYFKSKADPKNPQHNPLYAAMVRSLDDGVGRLLQAVDEAGRGRQHDHCVFLPTTAAGRIRPRSPILRALPTCRRPAICRNAAARPPSTKAVRANPASSSGPGKVKPATVNEALLQSTDFYPTLLAMCGVKPHADVKLDGFDQSGTLLGKASPRDRVFCHFLHGSTNQAESIPGFLPGTYVRQGDWKLNPFLRRQQ